MSLLFCYGYIFSFDHADINKMNVSVTMVKARISWVFISALPSSILNSRKDITVLWFS